MKKKKETEEDIIIDHEDEYDLDHESSDLKVVESNPLAELTIGEREDLEKGRVAYARELGTLLDRGIKEYGVEWTIGLAYVGIQYRVNKKNDKQGNVFTRLLKGIWG
jgi:hypothetical protein